MNLRVIVCALTLASALGASPALGQLPSYDLERLSLDPSARGSLVIGNGDVLPLYSTRVSMGAGWERDPLVLSTGGQLLGHGVDSNAALAGAIVHDRLTLHFGISATIAELADGAAALEVAVRAPMVAWQGGDNLASLGQPNSFGFARPWVGMRLSFASEERGMPVSAAVAADVLIPPGRSTALAGEDTATVVPRLELGRSVGPVGLAVQAGGILRPHKVNIGNDQLGDELTGGLAVYTHGGPLRGEVSLRGASTLSSDLASRRSLEALAGLRYAIRSAEVFALGGPGFYEAPGSPTWRALAGVAYQFARPQKMLPPPAAIAKAPPPEPPPAIPAPAPVVAPPPPPPSPEAAAPAPKAVLTKERIELKETVYFETGKADVRPTSFPMLDEVAGILEKNPQVTKVVVEGHTDASGKAAMNRKLSQARAEAVRAYLVSKGVDAARLEAKGYGPDRPIADNKTPDGREQNRRVELKTAETGM